MIIGKTITGDTYTACIKAMEAHEHPTETCPRLGISEDEWMEIGKLAFGGDGLTHIIDKIRQGRA